MENASKALLIASAILLCILIISIGMFVYNRAQSTITDSLNSLSTHEIESFNNQFLSYEGIQKGTNVKMLLGKLIANANTYADEPLKIPVILFKRDKEDEIGVVGGVKEPGIIKNYIDKCGKIKNVIKTNKEYNVLITFQKSGLIDLIYIYYDLDATALNWKDRLHREDFIPK